MQGRWGTGCSHEGYEDEIDQILSLLRAMTSLNNPDVLQIKDKDYNTEAMFFWRQMHPSYGLA